MVFGSREYADDSKGGDWTRDGLGGADGEIGNFGFAVAQIGDAEAYFRYLSNTDDPTNPGQKLLPSGAQYNVAG